jgi:rod shape determining protein RodA
LIALVRDHLNSLKRANLAVTALVVVLLAVSLAFIWNIGQQTPIFSRHWLKQLLWITLGSTVMLMAAGIDYKHYGKFVGFIYGSTMLLLVLVLIPGIGTEINNARSWIKPVPAVSLQPSEFAKLGLIVALAWYASRPWVDIKRPRCLATCAGLALLPMALVGMQPDMGSVLSLVPLCIVILFVSGLPIRWFVYAGLSLALMSPLVYHKVFKDHHRERIQVFLNPATADNNLNWNARQSMLAVGSGGVFGKGFGKGTQNVLGFLPKRVAPTDFIFSVIAEEMGFVGSTVLVLMFALLLVYCIYIGSIARDDFGRNLACAIGALYATHMFINIGMTMGLAPIIGIPLPFISYGGSFMLLTLASVGVLQSVYIHRNERSPDA